jgi:tetraacyldisaccharide 4'-kinase
VSGTLARWLQNRVDEIWYERAEPPPWLLPFSLLFELLTTARRTAYRKGWLRSRHAGCPTIVAGNLSVGGTGKTPFVCWLAAQLAEQGFKPGIVSRGYGGSSSRPRLINVADEAERAGDEPLLLARRSAMPVATGRNRPAACRLLVAAGCDVIISDDGLQHYAMARDCEIVLVDAQRGMGNGRLLPSGPLREPLERLHGVDAVVVNGERLRLKRGMVIDGALSMRLNIDGVRSVAGEESRQLSAFAGRTVHAVAGIGNPARFFEMLRSRGLTVIEHPLPDHARIKPADVNFGDQQPVLMTEKDAVKCLAFARPWHWYVPVSAYFDDSQARFLLHTVMAGIDKQRGGAAQTMEQ